MPAQTTKTGLLALTETEFRKLSGVVDKVPEDMALVPDGDGVSVKDVIGHRAHWITLFIGWWQEGQAGRRPEMPAPGYNWGDLKRFNADLREAQAALGWHAARAILAERHGGLITFLEGLSEAQLYGGPMPGGGNAWTTGRWAEAAGPSHYRSAAKYLRARLRAVETKA
ncbi:MAG: ClbS/DfsB family four-helix bundle protein [Pseudomonadota bacterium]